jgi:hypothetical protein
MRINRTKCAAAGLIITLISLALVYSRVTLTVRVIIN